MIGTEGKSEVRSQKFRELSFYYLTVFTKQFAPMEVEEHRNCLAITTAVSLKFLLFIILE